MSMFRRLYGVFTLVLLTLIPLYGQTGLRFDNYYIEDGLPHSRSRVIFQDYIGWIWIGTEGGIARFDGTSFTVYTIGESEENIPTSNINSFWEDDEHRLWIGTMDDGLVLYNRSLDRLERYTHSDTCTNCISSNQVYSMVADSSGTMWIGTGRGLDRYDPATRRFQRIARYNGVSDLLSSDTIQKVFLDGSNRLWMGTFRGLDFMDLETGKITNFALNTPGPAVPVPGERIEDICQDDRGNLLVATYLDGLFVVSPGLEKTIHILPDPGYQRSYTIRSVLPDQNGGIWLGTRGGIYILDQGYNVKSHYINSLQNPNSLGHNSVSDIFRDRTGDIWVATRSGISYANLRSMAFYSYGASADNNHYLNNPEVYAICQSNDGRLWMGTESGGVNILDKSNGLFTYFTHDENNSNSICSNCVKAIIQDRKDNFWIGTFLGGLDYYDVKRKRFIHFVNDPENDNSLLNNTVWALHEDRNGTIWIGTDAGLDRYDPAGNRFHHIRVGVKNQPIHVIYEDRAGNLYFGSSNGNLTVMQPDNRLYDYTISARVIFEDSHDRIWIGSDGHDGLMQFDIQRGVIKTYKIADGLPSNQVYGILEDDNHMLWVSTGQGLSKFDPEAGDFKTYKSEDGIRGDRFYYGAYCKCKTGELLFGGQNGLTGFNPAQLSENQLVPPVVITDFKIFNKRVSVGEEIGGRKILDKSIGETREIRVNYDQSVLTFDFVALNYLNSSKNVYAYMLENFENDWNYVGSNRSATYTNLDPGSYVFRVKGTNNNGKWNEAGTSLKIVVIPPFTKTLVFRILLLLMVILIIYFIIVFFVKREKLKNQLLVERVKSKELHKIDMMKLQFFTNISHEIRTPISLIVSPLARIKNTSLPREQILSDIDVVYRNALRLGKLVDQLLDYRKLEAGKLKLELSRGNIVAFLENVIYMFREMSVEKKVELKFYSALDQVQIYFDPDKIEKVIFNLLSNAFKHTPEGGTINVTISLTYLTNQDLEDDDPGRSGEYVQIVVRDTGSGIEERKREHIFDRFYQGKPSDSGAHYGTGIGLSLSRELIKIHNGRILLKSQVGIGTEITVLIPAIKSDQVTETRTESQDVIELPHAPVPDGANVKTFDHLADSDHPVVLILEDNRELLEFVKSIFQEEYTVLLAEDGETGLELARETIPDLVISDVMMPRTDGIKVCKKLKSDFRTSHIPVILLTALTSKHHEKEGILGGADEYITKPFDPSLLKIKVDQLLATRRLLREKYSSEYLLNARPDGTSTEDDKFLAKLVAIIEENIDDPEFGTVKISREVGVSRTQLYRKMAAITNMTVKEFIRTVRLKKAAQLIVQDQLNISEAAYTVGFMQVAYFRKCFKEMFGVTPSAYAKSKSARAQQELFPPK